MVLPELLPPVLQRLHQIQPIKPKTAPVLDHTQAFACPIEIGINHPGDSGIIPGVAIHGTHGSLG